MTVRHIIWLVAPVQSNGIGPNPCEAGPDIAAVKHWKDELGVTVGPALTSLLGAGSGGTGSDYTFGRLLLAKAFRPIMVTIGRGSTAANAYIPGGAYYTDMMTSLTNAWSAIRAAYPGDSFVHHHWSDQGEYELRQWYPTPSPAELAIINAWATNYELGHAALESVIGKTADRFVEGTNFQVDLAYDPVSFRALQRSAAEFGTGNPNRFSTRDTADGVTYADAGQLHYNQAGSIVVGQRKLASFQAVTLLGSLGSDVRVAWVGHIRNKSTRTPAATHYLHLYADAALTVPLTAGTAASYAPASNPNNTTTWPAPAERMVSNGVAFTFPTPTGTWPSVWGWKLTDSATPGGGTVIAQHAFPAAVPVSAGTGAPEFVAGAITIAAESNVSYGGFADSIVHGLLGLEFGGTAYAPAWLTTTFPSYWAGDPAGSGAQAGSRVSVTQASSWNASGATSVDIALAQQPTGTFWAEHDASSGGSLLFSAPRPSAVGMTGVVGKGQVQTSIQ